MTLLDLRPPAAPTLRMDDAPARLSRQREDPDAQRYVAAPYLLTTSVHRPAEAVTWTPHSHPEHELLWTDRGVVTMLADGKQWTVTPGVGLWLPAGTLHEGSSREDTEVRTTYFDPGLWQKSWERPVAVRLQPAARELLLYLKRATMSVEQRVRAQQVCVDMLELTEGVRLDIPLPEDPRLALLVEMILSDPADDRSLEQWASMLNMTSRTLTRTFSAEVAMSFAQWRRLVRMRAALGQLSDGRTVKSVARRVGYSTTSAFVTAFRKTVGCTPGELSGRL
ncbi:helix-turn-helix transcriptional regulator [Leucobacter aridicollis]|uniref:HTH-type transcriptional regulator RipA n=1 Tax=Leucobacter aridicollis TaxID=283878 RepID=A0A852R2M6_9MICO|nr:AraC family transcriptional regulator [Leucobacter aridicollis]MBL3682043.1 AraC family transcriptional regulator [Leucobacter aridicollis]NYD26907.1 AraC-like DNA-binding protein/mannose-6-phosphate isomerase-like protein (cupin superfamily) [Leucobacter aridicollis]